jgi:diguanylate cyclase (GGDEF)-like protein
MMEAITENDLIELQLFQGVENDTLAKLPERCPVVEFDAGVIILSPQKGNDRMYVILDGEVSIRANDAANTPLSYAYRGESIGEMSVQDGRDPSAIVQTETPVRLLEISSDVLLTLIDESHAIARNLFYLLSNRLRTGNQSVAQSIGLQKQYEKHANVDMLTSLHNRRWLDGYFAELEQQRQETNETPVLVMLLLDVDHFKAFNDNYGHLAGDQVLKAVANSMRKSTRSSDLHARYGGEEFVVLLPDTDLEVALAIAERVRTDIKSLEVYDNKTLCPRVTASIGVAQLEAGDTAETLYKAADTALYKAKANGRDQCRLAER